jgi:hypothetical protein
MMNLFPVSSVPDNSELSSKRVLKRDTPPPPSRCVGSFWGDDPLTPNGHHSGRTAPLTSRRSILNIYSTNIRTEYFKHVA